MFLCDFCYYNAQNLSQIDYKMGNCAHHCRFFSQRRLDLRQVPKNRFLSPQLKKSNNQIVLKPFQYLSAPNQTQISTSNTRTSTQRQTSLVDVIDEYNHEAKVLQIERIKNEVKMILTQSYYVQPGSTSSRREIVNSLAKNGPNEEFQQIQQREVHNHQSKNMPGRQNVKQKLPTILFNKTTSSY